MYAVMHIFNWYPSDNIYKIGDGFASKYEYDKVNSTMKLGPHVWMVDDPIKYISRYDYAKYFKLINNNVDGWHFIKETSELVPVSDHLDEHIPNFENKFCTTCGHKTDEALLNECMIE